MGNRVFHIAIRHLLSKIGTLKKSNLDKSDCLLIKVDYSHHLLPFMSNLHPNIFIKHENHHKNISKTPTHLSPALKKGKLNLNKNQKIPRKGKTMINTVVAQSIHPGNDHFNLKLFFIGPTLSPLILRNDGLAGHNFLILFNQNFNIHWKL